MKKIIFAFAVVVAAGFASCTETKTNAAAENDSTVVDSAVVDSAVVDSAAADTTVAQ